MKQLLIILLILVTIQIISLLVMNQPKFGRLPRGERLERIKQSPNYREGQFHNQHPTPQMTSEGGRARAMWDFIFEKRERNRPEEPIKAIKSDLKNLPVSEDLLVWFGHSSYLLQLNGSTFLIDPVFEDASPFSFINKPFKGTQIYAADDMPNVDYLIITHDHWDHLDYKTIIKLKPRIGKVIVPLGVGEHFEYWGFPVEDLIEMDWQESAILPSGDTITALPTRHFSGRDFRSNRTLWASYMLQSREKNIYIGGDGGYDSHYLDIASQFPDIDIALMENGQYNKDWRYIHLMPSDLLQAIKDLNPKFTLPGHNSKYALAKHPWDEPINNMREAAPVLPSTILLPTIGEIITINELNI